MGQGCRVQGTGGRGKVCGERGGGVWEGWRDVGRGVEECGGRDKVCGGRGGGAFGRVVCGWGR